MRRLALAVCFAAALMGAAAEGQERRGATPGEFDLWLLALSWSPGFCEAGGDERESRQCAPGASLGFVVHGLWPQYERGYPSFCRPDGPGPRRGDLALVEGIVPTDGLARHQWRKHGSCSGLSPGQYLRAIALLWPRITVPDGLSGDSPEADTSPQAIERAFAAANPGLRPDMMTVSCGRGDGRTILREVRLCLTRDLRAFRRCPDDVERDMCRSRVLTVPAGR